MEKKQVVLVGRANNHSIGASSCASFYFFLKMIRWKIAWGQLAQWLERMHHTHEATGSNPVLPKVNLTYKNMLKFEVICVILFMLFAAFYTVTKVLPTLLR